MQVTCSSGAVTLNMSQQEVIPSPSFRVSRYCPYEIKRFKLAQKGRTLLNIIQCPNACGAQDLRKVCIYLYVYAYNRRFLKTYTQTCRWIYGST